MKILILLATVINCFQVLNLVPEYGGRKYEKHMLFQKGLKLEQILNRSNFVTTF